MSQLAPARPLPRTSPRRAAPTPRQLRVVAPPQGQGNGLFLALCVALLLGGFVAVLVLNTAMAKGSYTMRDLQRRSDALADNQDALTARHRRGLRPRPLAQRARDLGMVPAASPAFLRLSDGRVLGVAKKAKADSTFSVVTETEAPTRSTPVATAPAPTAAKPAGAPATPTAGPPRPRPPRPRPSRDHQANGHQARHHQANGHARPAPPRPRHHDDQGTDATTDTGATKPPVADPAPTN